MALMGKQIRSNNMKILKITLLVVFTLWLNICTAYCSITLFNKPISYLVSILSGGMIGYYFSLILIKYMENTKYEKNSR